MKVYQGTQSNSNCLTYIPQDIKLELNNGTLTLKAGSKVYIPNGFEADGTTPKFDVVIIENDLLSSGRNYDFNNYIFIDSNTLAPRRPDYVFSGETAPSSTNNYTWYDTANNVIKYYENGAWTTTRNISLPLAIVTSTSSSSYTNIVEVFNGFGYIVSTIFALPGVKGLVPNGRNADNTLKSIEYTTDKVSIQTYTGTSGRLFDLVVGINYLLADENTYDRQTNTTSRNAITAGNAKWNTSGNCDWIQLKAIAPETIPSYKVAKSGTRRNYYKYTYSAWTRPNVSGFSTLGGDNFAITNGGTYQLYAIFDGNNSSWGQMYSTNEDARTLKFYNPKPIQINSFTVTNYPSTSLTDSTWYGSNDGTNWINIFSFTNSTVSSTQTINFPANSGYYKYFKMRVDKFSIGFVDIYEMTFNATVKNTVAGTSSDYDFYEDIDVYKIFDV